MGSRIRENVKHFFECFCEIVPKTEDKEAWIIQQYPDSYKDQEILRSVPKFAYPCNFENNIVQHYSFVLTDIESKWTFGFCRHDPKTETALVVLSYLPWHQAFYKFLNNIAVLLHSPRSEDLRDFLYAVFSRRVPEPGSVFVVPFNKGESTFTCECPDKYKLPSIPENRNLTEYYNAVDANNMMVIFAAILNERRIIFTSRRLYRLSACVQSANDIIYPMIWQHIFIPVLPKALVDYLLAPMPFLIGVPYEVLKTVHKPDIGDVVILDADANTIETPFDDLSSFPQEIVSSLKRQLRNRGALLGDGVSRAFLRALVQLIGGYRDALRFQQGEDITFNEQAFIETRSATMQPFLKKMLQLQIFQQFIEERLQMLNKGEGFTDEFEMEVHIYSEKSSGKLKQQYKDWTSTMKKEGTAFFKSVKDKANPAVKTAVKSVKEGGKGMKSAYKGLKSKFRESQGPEYMDRGMRVYVEGSDKPRSAPNSPTGKRRPFTSFGMPKSSYRKEKTFINPVTERPYSPLSPASNPCSPDTPDRSHSATPGLEIPNMDLLTELKDLLKFEPDKMENCDSPPIDRSLKPVRSLESFKHATGTSPDGWAANTTPPCSRLRSGPSLLTPSPNHLYGHTPSPHLTASLFDTPNSNASLIGFDDDDVSPPALPVVPPPRPTPPRDLFGSTPFVVGGGCNENGDAVFLVASDNNVDMVKLSAPAYSPRRKRDTQLQQSSSDDLIRLDSNASDDLDDFDPLLSKDRGAGTNSSSPETQPPSVFIKGLSNPLYTYCLPNGNGMPDTSSKSRDNDLLQEYGLDFNSISAKFNNVSNSGNLCSSLNNFNNSGFPASNAVKSPNQWTTFE